MQNTISNDIEKCVIIGSGPAGYTAAVYASRANLFPVIIEGLQPGGQLTTTTEVENFPGYKDGVDGNQMMMDLKSQAERFGARSLTRIVQKIDFDNYPYKIYLDNGDNLITQSIILATGATAKYLGLDSETKYKGAGVSACAICDGFFYKGLDVAVVGGGDTAAEEALFLSNLCNKVYMIIRKDYMRASKTMADRVVEKENIEILYNYSTKELYGDDLLKGVLLNNTKTNEELDLRVEGFFVAIGHSPNSEFLEDVIELDENNYVKTLEDSTCTNMPGVFACGDLADPIYRQAVTAAGTGCMAAMDAEKYLAKLM
ncbi:MAG: thioredoxin-disulfide reductase [Marinifilaceae bacterium]|jgi:thioredoxin reductase (NADPH)|nr:thioredoxin-disulfide reductase [Marinifilaceae bacterium]